LLLREVKLPVAASNLVTLALGRPARREARLLAGRLQRSKSVLVRRFLVGRARVK
jgi:hypothetical protein